jgi:hypothetical protein
MVKIAERLITEHVGIAADAAPYPALREAVRVQFAAYPERQAVFDGPPSVRLRQLERLRDALQKTDRGARFLIEGLTTDRRGFPKPEVDLSDLEARIESEIGGLRMEMRGSSAKQRPTETARDYTAVELAAVFKRHYRLEAKEYRLHLDAFLRGLFHANRIAYPDPHDDYKQRDAFLRRLRLI